MMDLRGIWGWPQAVGLRLGPPAKRELPLLYNGATGRRGREMAAKGRGRAPAPGRGWQLALGMLALVMVANLQYSWTLFVNPLRTAHDWSLVAVQWTFTLFVLAETWCTPFEGYLADRFGPRRLVAAGGVLVGASWVGSGFPATLP